jgi:hypothetical protein
MLHCQSMTLKSFCAPSGSLGTRSSAFADVGLAEAQTDGHEAFQVTLCCAHLAPVFQLEAVQRLCDTGFAQSGTD